MAHLESIKAIALLMRAEAIRLEHDHEIATAHILFGYADDLKAALDVQEPPYLTHTEVIHKRAYNPNYGDDRVCRCGHPYYRHFDSYEDMEPVGCKYCPCGDFQEYISDNTGYEKDDSGSM